MSFAQLCSSRGVEHSETWLSAGLFSFLLVSVRVLGLTFMGSEISSMKNGGGSLGGEEWAL